MINQDFIKAKQTIKNAEKYFNQTEVLSDTTRRTDEGEKKDAYLTIPSLTHYLLAEPDAPLVTARSLSGRGSSAARPRPRPTAPPPAP